MKNLFVLVLATLMISVQGNYFKDIEQMLISEKAKLATQKLGEDLAGGADSPKEISIYCPSVRRNCFQLGPAIARPSW